MGKFVANPDILRAQGNKIMGQSQQFGHNVEKVYSTINEMVTSSYLSPEAIAIAKEIETYRDDLNRMRRAIEDYGKFCINAGAKVVRNQENVISEIQ